MRWVLVLLGIAAGVALQVTAPAPAAPMSLATDQ